MSLDMEDLARAFGGDDTEKVNKMREMVQSDRGKDILTRIPKGSETVLREAGEAAKNGDMRTAKKLLSSLLSNKENVRLMHEIMDLYNKEFK